MSDLVAAAALTAAAGMPLSIIGLVNLWMVNRTHAEARKAREEATMAREKADLIAGAVILGRHQQREEDLTKNQATE